MYNSNAAEFQIDSTLTIECISKTLRINYFMEQSFPSNISPLGIDMTVVYCHNIFLDCCNVIEISSTVALLHGSYAKQSNAESGRDYYMKTPAGNEQLYLYWNSQAGIWAVSTVTKFIAIHCFYKYQYQYNGNLETKT